MKVSHNWLQTYFQEKLPDPEKLADIFTFHAFEVEGLEKIKEDTVYDLKVLPDRANYALSHRGIAREIAFNTELVLDSVRIKTPDIKANNSSILELDIQDKRCNRDSKLIIQNITNTTSPEWLKEKLEIVGQRSISFIVDVTNYVMLDMGQPLHAFDLDKLTKKDGKVKIVLKAAEKERKIKILGGKEYTLSEDVLIFADGNNNDVPLDIAGIKGGTEAEIDATTKNIVVLSANFDSSYIRKTSTKTGIKTDATKRSENGIPTELTMDGLLRVAEIVQKHSPEAVVEGIVDYYPNKADLITVEVSEEEIVDSLGVILPKQAIEAIFMKLDFSFKEDQGKYTISVPYYRLDIKIPEDVIEEVGRIYGYDKIQAALPPKISGEPKVNKVFYYSEKIKSILVDAGFSEVYTYVLADKGSMEIQNPLASDKSHLRENLTDGVTKAVDFNARNADFLGLDQIKLFEIGKEFIKGKEQTSLAVSVQNIKKGMPKPGKVLAETFQKLREIIDLTEYPNIAKIPDNIMMQEIALDEIIEKLPEPKTWDLNAINVSDNKFQKISQYPFAVRDIAVFTPEGTEEKQVRKIIEEKADSLLIKNRLFDVFTKAQEDGTKKTSYAFRLVFQSHEKTLTEDEINNVMTSITNTMNSKQGWQVR